TGCFLDGTPGAPAPKAEVEARRAALLAFVRGGKGLAGVHAATDSYHGTCQTAESAAAGAGGGGRGGGRGAGGAGGVNPAAVTPGGQLATQIVAATTKTSLTLADMDMVANTWFDKLDNDKSGRVAQADFTMRFAALTPAPAAGGARGARGAGGNQGGTPV